MGLVLRQTSRAIGFDLPQTSRARDPTASAAAAPPDAAMTGWRASCIAQVSDAILWVPRFPVTDPQIQLVLGESERQRLSRYGPRLSARSRVLANAPVAYQPGTYAESPAAHEYVSTGVGSDALA